MENQRLQECWPGRRSWKGKASVPCTRARPGVREIPEGERGPESCSCREGLREGRNSPSSWFEVEGRGCGSLVAFPAAGDGLGVPPLVSHVPSSPWVALGAQAVPPWAGGILHRECGHVPPVPLPPWPGPSGSRARQGWATGLCPSVGPESVLPGHSLPELLLLLRGTARCHRVAVGRDRGGGGVPSPCWQPWGGCCGSCWSSRAGLGCAGTIAALGLRVRVGTGGTRPPRQARSGDTRPSCPSFPVRVTGRGVAGGARREEEGGHEPFLPGSLSRDHLGLPGATGCRDTVAVLVPSCVATGAGGPEVAEGRNIAPIAIVVRQSPRHLCHL